MPFGEPIGEEQNEAGKQSRLGQPEQEAYRHKAVGAGGEGATRNDPPCDHDAGDPNAGADFLEDNVARHLEQDISPKEGARRHAVHRRVEPEIFVHRQRGEADVDAIEIAEEIGQDRKRQDAQIHFAHRCLLN